MRSQIVQAGQSPWAYCSPGCKAKDTEDEYHQGEDADLYIIGFYLFAQVLRRSADHESCEKNSQHHKHQHSIQSGTDTPENDLTQLDVKQRNQTAQRGKGIMHGVHGAARCIGCDRGEQGGIENPETDFLSFHISTSRVQSKSVQPGITGPLCPPADQDSTKE